LYKSLTENITENIEKISDSVVYCVEGFNSISYYNCLGYYGVK